MYLTDRFQVNRRYQRKLVWSVEEKQRLIDSILRDMPIPLFLVAELEPGDDGTLELIDGMQRLNAVFSFLENEFPFNGDFFDLNTLADTKYRLDSGDLTQQEPQLGRENSVKLSNYVVALSVFRAAPGVSVDDVFRRINSGGRRLSKQELRQAGTTSGFADLVRTISSRIRTDTSPSDRVPLRSMPQLSITNRELPYGVNVDEIFWVKEGILRRDDVRQSLGEQAVLDLLVDCIVDPLPRTGTRLRDRYYSFVDDENDGGVRTDEARNIETSLQMYEASQFEADFMQVYDEIREVLSEKGMRFAALMGVRSGGRFPRYFQSAGVSRHGEGDESSLHRRSSDPRWLRVMRRRP
jgi:hypothetical protein